MDNMHGNHGGEMGHGDQESCPMIMSFHAGHCETILWKSWTAKSPSEFVFSAIAIFAIAFLYEFLKYVREKIYYIVAQQEMAKIAAARKENGQLNEPCCPNLSEDLGNRTLVQKMFNRSHLIQTGMHVIHVAISYLLMLVVMTFNYWLCIAIIFGAAAGYFCFGWIRQQAVDYNEHCH